MIKVKNTKRKQSKHTPLHRFPDGCLAIPRRFPCNSSAIPCHGEPPAIPLRLPDDSLAMHQQLPSELSLFDSPMIPLRFPCDSLAILKRFPGDLLAMPWRLPSYSPAITRRFLSDSRAIPYCFPSDSHMLPQRLPCDCVGKHK